MHRRFKVRKAFTMIELIFVVAIIGILSAIAIPKFNKTVTQAEIAKAKSEVASLRSTLSTLRQKSVLTGNFDDIEGSTLESKVDLSSSWSVEDDTFTYTAPDDTTCAFSITDNKLVKDTCDVAGMEDL